MIDLEKGIFISPKERANSTKPLSTPIADLLKVQSELLKLATTNVQIADEAHFASAQASRTEFPVGSYVLLNHPTDPPTRLHARKRGPYQIIKFHKNDYTIRNLINHKELTVNVTRLIPFVYDPLYTDPRHVAMADNQEFEIDCILAHRGNLNLKSTLEFKVRWLGYNETADTWEPWKELRKTEQLHVYLRSKGLDRLIPVEFRS